MEKAKVFYTDFRTQLDVSQGKKLQRLCMMAGMDRIDFDGKFVAIKCTLVNWAILLISVPIM